MSCHFSCAQELLWCCSILIKLIFNILSIQSFCSPSLVIAHQILMESLIYKVATGYICTRRANVNLEKGSVHEALQSVCAWANWWRVARSWLPPAQWSWPHSVGSHGSRCCVLVTCPHSAKTHQLHYSLNSSDWTIKRANETPRRGMRWQWVHFSLLEPNSEEKIASWTCDPQDDPGLSLAK